LRTSNGPIDRPAPWLAVAFVLEAVAFYIHVQLRVAPYYPQAYDQLTYLSATFNFLDDLSQRGLAAFEQVFFSPLPTGITYPLQGAFAVLALGPSRAALLTPNLIYFLVAQWVMFLTVRRSRGDTASAWLAISIFAGCICVFKTAGGIADYRIDFAAMCLFGILVCALAWTEGFKSRKYSVIAGFPAAALILMRFITAAYVGPLFLILCCYVIFLPRRGPRVWPQVKNISISGAIVAAISIPALVAASQQINAYYVGGHFKGGEPAIRAAEFGVSSLSGYLLFYPKALMDYQIGTIGVIVIAALVITALIGKWRSHFLKIDYPFDAIVFLVSFIVPIIVLTCDVAKSPVAVGIVLIPLLLLVTTGWRSFAVPNLAPRLLHGIIYFIMASGAVGFLVNASAPRFDLSPADQAEIERLNKAIATSMEGFDNPRVAFDRTDPYLNNATATFYFRQVYGRAAPAASQSLGGIFAVQRDDALAAVQSSDIIVLSDKSLKRGQFPFEKNISQYWDALDDYAIHNLTLLCSGVIANVPHRIFVRQPRAGQRCESANPADLTAAVRR
jgi:hypothetical protein